MNRFGRANREVAKAQRSHGLIGIQAAISLRLRALATKRGNGFGEI
ncbi:MAG: hypothetical protein KDI42_05815 [Gammaproteobacteria bacterium]|nr:hypothetical protein [Gammaproteobacteria bacterium]